jgi:uroporphyrinogen decarboxylase
MGLTHRERVMRAVDHRMPDRVPLDLGGTLTSTIARGAYERLLQHLHLDGETRIIRRWAAAVQPDERLLRHFDIDTRMVAPRCDEGWNEYWRITPVPGRPGAYRDEWGAVWTKPETGPAFISDHPLAGAITAEDLERYPWPDPEDPERYAGLKEQARTLKEETDFAVIGVFPRPVVSLSQFLRGYDHFFLDMGLNRPVLESLMDRILEVDLGIGRRILTEIGQYVDLMFVHDDLATQRSLMFSPDHYRRIVKPRHRQICNLIKTRSDAKIIFHTDGAVFPILEDLVEIGVDALNPVQTSAQGMEPDRLQEAFGDRLCFWGAVESQRLLPHGTLGEVRAGVKDLIEALGKGGNCVLAAVHNIQDDVPPQNIVAMFEAAKEYGRYT